MDDEPEPLDSLLAAVARIPAKDVEQLKDWEPPAELDEYRLVKPLGRGGMGSVWLAEDGLLDRLVAIKFIAHAALDDHARERFAIEARAAARLQHGNVVTVHRFGEIAGRPYIVSEYIRGDSLDKVERPMPWARVHELGIALSRGLAAAHRHGIVHRDIKPANAILSRDGEVKLVDFGLAKLGDATAARDSRPVILHPLATGTSPTVPASGDGLLTAPGSIAGTPLYLAPEVRAGEQASRRSDVYQIGCILYELVTGRAPLLDAGTSADVPQLRVTGEGARFAAIVDRCLRRVPDERFASGEELREALERIAAPQVGGELPEGNPYRGLVAFEAEHRGLFFGRGLEIRAVIERLRAESFVLVTGDSGVGKSSLCRAGVLPHIADGAFGDGLAWVAVQLVPGQRPLATLLSVLAPHVDLDEAALLERMRDQPGDVGRELRRALGRTRGLVVFVDQLEELVTLASREEADAFGHVLAQLAGTPNIRILATVRGDFLTRVAELPALEAELARALYVLRPLSAEGAREAIVGPARAKGARFESEELVETLVAAVAADAAGNREHVELPLLAFTLAQLWDAREAETISARSLEAIGGVRGALARHADGVIESLLPAQRLAARRLLLRLVTADRTRERRDAAALGVEHDLVARAALDALVRGRLVVARGAGPPMFELAHERLIDGWPTLSEWLSRTAEIRALHARLGAAAADWERMSRAREALWRERQLAELAQLAAEDLTPSEAAFASASRSAVTRRRRARIAIVIAVPAIAASFYVGARLVAQRDLANTIDIKVGEATRDLATARTASDELLALRETSVAEFEAGKNVDKSWGLARRREAEAADAYARASRALEAALLLDTERRDVRRQLAEVTFERIGLADRTYRISERDDLKTRLALYDDNNELAQRLVAPAQLELAIEPKTATITIDDKPATASLAPGTHVLVAQAPGHATVRESVFVRRGERKHIAFTLPPAAAVPRDYIYIPPGEFLYGSRDDEPIRRFLNTAPMHPRRTPGYLIGRTEITYAQWIEFLDAISPAERAKHAPQIEKTTTIHKSGGVVLERVDNTWKLAFAPAGLVYEAIAGKPIAYAGRTKRQQQDWLRMPVSGIHAEDVQAYAAWLDQTKRVPGARLCTEPEWERAARGADGRTFPNGDATLAPDDANIDETYGRHDAAFGPDEVGAHPATTSPYGLEDTAGSLWEITKSSTGALLLRGGCYYTGVYAAVLSNRGEIITPTFKHVFAGARICADL
ncbi:MAG: SUMF1/EgtB/PvdO family nonheme iron enzyme [Myxococcota bacterium]|nr:SUMF1/EgtB/PvdO family nonheme iron enzyme [Myxococcota bacterium]